MKKHVSYIFLLILISFLIPVVLTKRTNNVKEAWSESKNSLNKESLSNITSENKENSVAKNNISNKYEQYKKVRVLHTKTNEVEEMNLDEYLYGVVSAEMPASFENEALKAQSIVARTYTLYKIINNSGNHDGADICDNSNCCQAWISKEERFNRWSEHERESNWEKIVRICK